MGWGIIEMGCCGVVLWRVGYNDRWSFMEWGFGGWGIIEMGYFGVVLWRLGYNDRCSFVEWGIVG